jgi:tripartite-type tricarboxylate transporter receptor subunit TctC
MKKDTQTVLSQAHDSSNAVSAKRRTILGALGASVASFGVGLPSGALAQAAYPNRSIKMMIPWPPGQATDLVGRSLAMGLTQILGQTVVAENKAGAGGMIGTDVVAKAAPDGYTLLAASSGPITVSPLLQSTPYNVDKDLTFIAMAGLSPYLLVTAPDFPVKDAAEFVALVKANPGKYTFASSGTGATAHLICEAFNARAGLKAVHVPYKGSSPALTDVMAGRVSYCIETAAGTMPFVRDGRLKALGVSLMNGSAVTPGIPPLATAANVPGFNLGAWVGLVAPGGLPQDLRERLAKAVQEIMQAPETKELYQRIAVEIDYKTGAEFAKYLSDTKAQFIDVIKTNNIKIEG